MNKENGFSLLLVLVAIVVLAGTAGAGYMVAEKQNAKQHNSSADADEQSKEYSEASITEKAPLTEDEKILKAAGCEPNPDTDCKVTDKADGRGIDGSQFLAKVSISHNEGGGAVAFLSKQKGEWQVLYKGNGDVPEDIQANYDFPEGWLGPKL